MAIVEGRWFTGSMTDKRYDADPFAEYGKRIFADGVEKAADMKVTASGLNISVANGALMLGGYLIRIKSGPLKLAVSPGASARTDRVVAYRDEVGKDVGIRINPGGSVGDSEISLAAITVPANATSVTVADERVGGFLNRKKQDIVVTAELGGTITDLSVSREINDIFFRSIVTLPEALGIGGFKKIAQIPKSHAPPVNTDFYSRGDAGSAATSKPTLFYVNTGGGLYVSAVEANHKRFVIDTRWNIASII